MNLRSRFKKGLVSCSIIIFATFAFDLTASAELTKQASRTPQAPQVGTNRKASQVTQPKTQRMTSQYAVKPPGKPRRPGQMIGLSGQPVVLAQSYATPQGIRTLSRPNPNRKRRQRPKKVYRRKQKQMRIIRQHRTKKKKPIQGTGSAGSVTGIQNGGVIKLKDPIAAQSQNGEAKDAKGEKTDAEAADVEETGGCEAGKDSATAEDEAREDEAGEYAEEGEPPAVEAEEDHGYYTDDKDIYYYPYDDSYYE